MNCRTFLEKLSKYVPNGLITALPSLLLKYGAVVAGESLWDIMNDKYNFECIDIYVPDQDNKTIHVIAKEISDISGLIVVQSNRRYCSTLYDSIRETVNTEYITLLGPRTVYEVSFNIFGVIERAEWLGKTRGAPELVEEIQCLPFLKIYYDGIKIHNGRRGYEFDMLEFMNCRDEISSHQRSSEYLVSIVGQVDKYREFGISVRDVSGLNLVRKTIRIHGCLSTYLSRDIAEIIVDYHLATGII